MSKSELKRVGLKVTLPRVKILQMLESADEHHMSAEEIYKRLLDSGDDVGLATVYRVLTQFEEAGLVVRHNFDGNSAMYELNHGEHHDHLVCVNCGKVKEFLDEVIEQRQNKIAQESGFRIIEHAFNIYGICDRCQ